jgi:CubicO group peptidase (beta-lactamase class C family)
MWCNSCFFSSRNFPFLLLAIFTIGSLRLSGQENGRFISNGREVRIAVFDANMKKMMSEIGIPGLSLAVIDNDHVVYSHTYGYKRTSPALKADQHAIFEAASLSKIFLVFTVQQLVQEGRFDLDKPMYQYLENPRLAHDSRYLLITPRMILSHTSGIENWQWDNNKDTLEIVSNPGEKFVYSGEGFQYLAKVIEKVLQEPYESYIDRMVLRPLAIGDTYFKYSHPGNDTARELPDNYAFGYDNFGVEFKKSKDTFPSPASGAQTIAGQYAKLIIGMFNGKYLSHATVDEMLHPVVRIVPGNDQVWISPGFMVIYNNKDTIVAFSGSNSGYKSELFYSVPHKRGFVFFTNSDRGSMISEYLCHQTARLDIDFLFVPSYYEQYPSAAISLFSIYREKGAQAMLAGIDRFKKQGKLDANALDELGDTFMGHDRQLAIKLLQENILLYPRSPLAYTLLGSAFLEDKKYDMAYKNLKMATDLHFDMWDISPQLKQCEEKIASNH